MNLIRSGLLALALAWGIAPQALAVTPFTQPGNADYTISQTDVRLQTTTAFSAARTWTLPAANATCIGQTCQPAAFSMEIVDTAGTITSTNTLTIARPTGGTINGNAANLILSAAGVRVTLVPTSSTNWNATVIGDFRSSTVAVGSAVALTTATAANITTISLSQGIWSCSANTARTLAATTSVTKLSSSISATTATSGSLGSTLAQYPTAANVMALPATVPVPAVRLALTATTTYYLVAEDIFTVDTNAAYGSINCQRLR